MKKRLVPDLLLDSIHDLDTGKLSEKGITSIILDIDNTLVSWSTKEPDERVNEFICRLVQDGFRLCILSNNTRKRVEEFNRCLNIPAIHRAIKPSKHAFKRAMKLLGSNPSNTAVIGDQLFTDVLGGNRAGLYTVLVSPISEKEFVWTRLVRLLEKAVLKRLLR